MQDLRGLPDWCPGKRSEAGRLSDGGFEVLALLVVRVAGRGGIMKTIDVASPRAKTKMRNDIMFSLS